LASTTYNLAHMNMLLHVVKDTEFEIHHGDTLTNQWDTLRDPAVAGLRRNRASTPSPASPNTAPP